MWDLRTGTVAVVMRGHSDTVTGLALSPDGSHVLSNAMDCTGTSFSSGFISPLSPLSAKVWDVRPFAPEQRCVKSLVGHQHNFEKVPPS